MDQERFDRFTKALATGQTRRSLLGGIGAGLIGALGWRGAAADHDQGHGVGHQGDQQNQGRGLGECKPVGHACRLDHQCCESIGHVCVDRACGCPPDQELVDGACVAVSDSCDGLNCDDTNPCTANSCIAGECLSSNVASGNACTTEDAEPGTCDGAGTCIPDPSPCDAENCIHDGNWCTETMCVGDQCVTENKSQGSDCSDLYHKRECDGVGNCVAASICNSDGFCTSGGNICKTAYCDLDDQCVIENQPLGHGCGDGMICDADGNCIPDPCLDPTFCPDDNPCLWTTCNQGTCVREPQPPGVSCTVNGEQGYCDASGTCEQQCIDSYRPCNPGVSVCCGTQNTCDAHDDCDPGVEFCC